MSVPAANLVGITGITRRLVQDGALDEAAARAAQADAAKDKRPIQKYLIEKKLVNQRRPFSTGCYPLPPLAPAPNVASHLAGTKAESQQRQKVRIVPRKLKDNARHEGLIVKNTRIVHQRVQTSTALTSVVRSKIHRSVDCGRGPFKPILLPQALSLNRSHKQTMPIRNFLIV